MPSLTLKHHSHVIFLALFTIIMSFTLIFAQQTPPPPSYNYSPAMATVVIVLIIFFFIVGVISVYIRYFVVCIETGPRGGVEGWRSERPRGVDSSVVDTFPTFLYSDVKMHHIGKSSLECAICLSEFSDNQVLRMLPICSHVFHPNCIGPWLSSHVTCPVCRADLKTPVNRNRSIDSLANQLEQSSNHELSESSDEIMYQAENHGRDVSVQVGVSPLVSENVIKTPMQVVKGVGSPIGKLPRSHTTGHSLLRIEDCERYTLRLPEEVRNKLVNINLSSLPAAIVSPRVGYRARNVGCTEMPMKPDRWWFSASPPFIFRPSLTSSPINNNNFAGSTSGQRSLFRSLKSPWDRGVRSNDVGERSSDKLWPNRPSQESELEGQ